MSKPVSAIWRIELTVPDHSVPGFELALEPYVESLASFILDEIGLDEDARDQALSGTSGDGTWYIAGYSRTPFERAAVEAALAASAAAMGIETPALGIDRVPDTDWVSATLRSFPPIVSGRFFVHGSHFEGPVPAGRIGLMIDAGTAFGSGEHATTWGCLKALDGLARRRHFRRPLDLGCGSGILAMAMAKVWAVPVVAADIDPESVRVARVNAARNRVGARLTVAPSDGYRNPVIGRGRPYDLIVANILARPLMRLAKDLAAHLAPGGQAVLSGLLRRQERMVLAAHRRHGLALQSRIRVGDWSTLVLRRRN